MPCLFALSAAVGYVLKKVAAQLSKKALKAVSFCGAAWAARAACHFALQCQQDVVLHGSVASVASGDSVGSVGGALLACSTVTSVHRRMHLVGYACSAINDAGSHMHARLEAACISLGMVLAAAVKLLLHVKPV